MNTGDNTHKEIDMSKQQWAELWHYYRSAFKYFGSIAISLVELEREGTPHEQVALLAKVVLVNDDSLGRG